MVDSLEVHLIYKKSLETYGLFAQMENLEHLGLVDTRKSDRIVTSRGRNALFQESFSCTESAGAGLRNSFKQTCNPQLV